MGRRGRRVGDLLRHELRRKKERRGGERENASRVTKSTEAKIVCIFRYLETLKESLLETGKQHFPKTVEILRYKVFTLENEFHILYLNKLPIPS